MSVECSNARSLLSIPDLSYEIKIAIYFDRFIIAPTEYILSPSRYRSDCSSMSGITICILNFFSLQRYLLHGSLYRC